MRNMESFPLKCDRFDRYSWKVSLLRTQEELDHMLDALDAARKRIKGINLIGVAKNLRVSPLDLRQGKKVRIPCVAKICEPVVIVFEDDSTLELRPGHSGGLLTACNQIPSTTKDGLNRSNFASEKLFAGAAGAMIEGISLTEHIREVAWMPQPYIARITWDIHLSGDYDLRIEHNFGGWFDFSMVCKDTGLPAELPGEEILQHIRCDDQFRIVEGHGGGAYFQISPVRHTEVTEDNEYGIEECREEEISVEEDDAFYYLYYFLNKYFDKEYPYGEARPSYCEDGFEWSLEHNIYTYETVRTMLDEIEECAHLLATDFHNEKLNGLKNKVCHHPLDIESDADFQQLPAEKQEKELANRIAGVCDFYERFVTRMRKMMDSASEYELISFVGP